LQRFSTAEIVENRMGTIRRVCHNPQRRRDPETARLPAGRATFFPNRPNRLALAGKSRAA
jgi:hypothetical protein